METLLESTIPLILFLQSLGEGLAGFMHLFTFLGDEEFYLILFPVIFWCVDNRLGFRAGVILLLSSTVNAYFKWIFRLPRPFWVSNDVVPKATETSFGAPSGHSQNAVAMWGLIASSIRKPWVWAVTIFVIFMIGLSRLVLGMHFLLDVLLGWTIGAILLWIFLRLEPSVERWAEDKSVGVKVGFAFLASTGLILIAVLIQSLLRFWEIPALWVQNAALALPEAEGISPLALSGVISNAGVLFGVSVGYILMNHRGGFTTQGTAVQQVLKYIIGIIGVLVIWMGLKSVFPDGETLVPFLFRYLRYGLAGLWISLGAPLIFVKAGLAQPAQK